jgi:hypothetical protein
LNESGETFTDLAVVDDACIRDVDRLNSRGVWFQFLEPVPVDPFATDLVRLAAFINAFESREFLFLGCDDDLAAKLEGDSLFGAKRLHGDFPFSAIDSLKGAGAVVNARMQNSGIVAGLMVSDVGFFLQDCDLEVWTGLIQTPSGRQPDDSASNNDNVELIHEGAQTKRADRSTGPYRLQYFMIEMGIRKERPFLGGAHW